MTPQQVITGPPDYGAGHKSASEEPYCRERSVGTGRGWSESATTQVGIIGAGTVGILHSVAWSSILGVRIATVVDTDESAGKALARRHGASCSPSVRDFDDVDVVSVCSPTYLHLEHVTAAVELGADVLLEKPATLTPEDLGKMRTLARKAGVRLRLRAGASFSPELQQARAWIEEGRIDRLRTITETSRVDADNLPEWYFRKEYSGGGVLVTSGVNGLDLLLWLADVQYVEPLRAEVRCRSELWGVEDFAKAYLYLDDVACNLEHSWKTGAQRHWTLTAVGTKGAIKVSPYHFASLSTASGTDQTVLYPEGTRYPERVGACLISEMEIMLNDHCHIYASESEQDLATHHKSLELVRDLYRVGDAEKEGSGRRKAGIRSG